MSLVDEEMFKKKYLKYKRKYNMLKMQLGGENLNIGEINESLIIYKDIPTGVYQTLFTNIYWYGFFTLKDKDKNKDKDKMIMFRLSDSDKLLCFDDTKFKPNITISDNGVIYVGKKRIHAVFVNKKPDEFKIILDSLAKISELEAKKMKDLQELEKMKPKHELEKMKPNKIIGSINTSIKKMIHTQESSKIIDSINADIKLIKEPINKHIQKYKDIMSRFGR
jgi:hypothetical protein